MIHGLYFLFDFSLLSYEKQSSRKYSWRISIAQCNGKQNGKQIKMIYVMYVTWERDISVNIIVLQRAPQFTTRGPFY